MDRRHADSESQSRVPYTCGDVVAALREARDALEDAQNGVAVIDAIQTSDALCILSDKLNEIEEASESGRSKLRAALIDSILETEAAQAETREAEKERDNLREYNNDMAQQIRELEARVQELENQ